MAKGKGGPNTGELRPCMQKMMKKGMNMHKAQTMCAMKAKPMKSGAPRGKKSCKPGLERCWEKK